ncbi:hypothetical protein [Streptomyces althioticus]|uniref:hypothetical protein n=1 Tax=Streptomyces althioticus TaxID=83380 RepID=UPI0036C127F8
MFSLEDDLTVVAGLNERLASLNDIPEAEPVDRVCSECSTSTDNIHAAEEGTDA